jgi:hypothetical protein
MTKARDLAELIGNSLIDGDEIATGAVGTSNLAATLDFSSKTMVMANDQLSGDKIHGGTISGFTSTGIDDNASGTTITLDSNKLNVHSGIQSSSTGVIYLLQNTNGAEKKAAGIGILVDNGGESTNAAGMFFQTASGGALSERMRLTSSGGLELGYSGAARQQADGQAFSIITPATGGGQGIALKRLDSNNDQVLGSISWSNNTQDGLSYIVSKTDGATNTTDIKLQVSKAGTLVTALMLDGSEGGKAWFSGQIRTDRIGTSTNSKWHRSTLLPK